MSAEYQIWLKTPNGVPLAVLDRFTSLHLQRIVNDKGLVQLTLPWGAYPISYFQDDAIIEVWRSVDGGLSYLEGETVFFLEYLEKSMASDGSKILNLEAYDPIFLLDHAVVAYDASTSYTQKSGKADDVIKAILRENVGSLATDTARAISEISVMADLSRGPTSSKGFAHRMVLDVLKEIAADSYTAGSYLAYDLVSLNPASGVSLEFRTYMNYRGTDHRWPTGLMPILVDPDAGNVTEVIRAVDRRTMSNYVYAGGQGQGSQRVTKTASDSNTLTETPWSRREVYIDARNSADPNSVSSEARQELRTARTKKTFSARIVDTPGLKYGLHYRFGDFVTTQFDGELLDARIDAIDLKVNQGVETLSIALRSDS